MIRKFALAAMALALGLAAGCVERALVITSEPSGADIVVNQQWRGKTPYILPFKHYGVYDIWIEHPGFEENGKRVSFYPLHVGEPIQSPGYQYPGVDFVTEVLLPTTLRDQHNLHYVLERVDRADEVDDVLSRAQQLREASQTRTRMRYERDMQRGRRAQGESPQSAATPSGAAEAPADGAYRETLPDADRIDATPPSPSEVPLFAP